MSLWTDTDQFYRDLTIMLAQTALFVIILLLSYWLLHVLLNRLSRLPALTRFNPQVRSIRRRAKIVLFVISILGSLGILGYNGYLIYQGQDLYLFYQELILALSPGFWRQLAANVAQIFGLLVVAIPINRLVRRGLTLLCQRAAGFEQLKANDESVTNFFDSLSKIWSNTLWLFLLGNTLRLLFFPAAVTDLLFVGLRIYLVIGLGLLLVKGVAAIVDSLDELSLKYSAEIPLLRSYTRFRGLIPLLRRCLEYAVYIFVATLVLLQVDSVAQFAEYGPRLVKVIGIFFLSRVIVELTEYLVDRSLGKQDELTDENRQRRLTLFPLIKSLLRYLVYFGGFVLMLSAMNWNPAPVLAGAGLVGLVVGLGAQPLINDIVSGFFILFENLFLVGDYIETASARGVVEAIDIRTTRIRDPNGQQHILRNGQLNEIINFSKSYTYAVVEVGVAYDSDLDEVFAVLIQAGDLLRSANEAVLAPTAVQGVSDFGASEVVIRTVTKVKPGEHLQIARDFRKLIKEQFDQAGIEIPFAQRVVTIRSADLEDAPQNGSLEFGASRPTFS